MLNWKFKLFIVLLLCTLTNFFVLVSILNGYKKTTEPFQQTNFGFEKVPINLEGGFTKLSQKEIIILHWTTYWDITYPPNILDSDKCSALKTGTIQQPPVPRVFDIPCRITFDHNYLKGSHAVVFHSPDLNYKGRQHHDLSETRRVQNQIWVWYTVESPSKWGLPKDLKGYQNPFNWTMSYRRDSDVYFPYGYLSLRNISKPTAHNPSNPFRKSLKKKSRLAAWIVSDCVTPSKREYLVEQLQKYIPVDIFGSCGKNKCPPRIEDKLHKSFYPCYNHIQSRYKFYLSFENSLCVDYITEKFFYALKTDMVPVVYGGGINGQNMDYLAVAPENSFIDARKFKSAQDLANYLIYLDGNDDDYLKYFEWKLKYQLNRDYYEPYGFGWCNLCQRVYEQISESSWNKSYSDLYTWWNYESVPNASVQLSFASHLKSPVSAVGQNFQFSLEQLQPICKKPKSNFTSL